MILLETNARRVTKEIDNFFRYKLTLLGLQLQLLTVRIVVFKYKHDTNATTIFRILFVFSRGRLFIAFFRFLVTKKTYESNSIPVFTTMLCILIKFCLSLCNLSQIRMLIILIYCFKNCWKIRVFIYHSEGRDEPKITYQRSSKQHNTNIYLNQNLKRGKMVKIVHV